MNDEQRKTAMSIIDWCRISAGWTEIAECIEQLIEDADDRTGTIACLEERIDAWATNAESMRTARESGLKTQIAVLENRLEDAETRTYELKAENDDLKSHIESLYTENSDLHDVNAELYDANMQLREHERIEIAELKAEKRTNPELWLVRVDGDDYASVQDLATEQAAREAAEKLAMSLPGETASIFVFVDSCKAGSVAWKSEQADQ